MLDGINNSSFNKEEWAKIDTKTNFSDLSLGYLVIKNDVHWVVLGIRDNQDVNLGSEPFDSLQEALNEATNNNNWDPRKLVFNKDGNGPLKIAWAGRVGSSSSNPGSKVLSYTGYDKKYSRVIGNKTFKVLSEYNVVGFDDSVTNVESKGFSGTVQSYIYEKTANGSGGGRKAWFWFGGTFNPNANATVQNSKGLRFGYGTANDDYPTQTGTKERKNNTLRKMGQTDSQAENNSDPDGKAFFFRKVDPSENIPNNSVYFLTTMVAYNIRMKPTENKELQGLETDGKIKNVQEGIMEFDYSSYQDAESDQFDSAIDSLKSNIPKDPIKKDEKNQSIKIPFIFFRSAS